MWQSWHHARCFNSVIYHWYKMLSDVSILVIMSLLWGRLCSPVRVNIWFFVFVFGLYLYLHLKYILYFGSNVGDMRLVLLSGWSFDLYLYFVFEFAMYLYLHLRCTLYFVDMSLVFVPALEMYFVSGWTFDLYFVFEFALYLYLHLKCILYFGDMRLVMFSCQGGAGHLAPPTYDRPPTQFVLLCVFLTDHSHSHIMWKGNMIWCS